MNNLLPIPWFLPPISRKAGLNNLRISKPPLGGLGVKKRKK